MAHQRDLMHNGGFEKSIKHGWEALDHRPDTYFSDGVYSASGSSIEDVKAFDDRFGFGFASPSEGDRALYIEWDGKQGDISIDQHVDLRKTVTDVLSFDYQAGWDLFSYGGQADRHFTVEITDLKTGAVTDYTVLTAAKGTYIADTGLQHYELDLSALHGHQIDVKFIWDIPATDDGPAVFMLDNVQMLATVKKASPAQPAASDQFHFDQASAPRTAEHHSAVADHTAASMVVADPGLLMAADHLTLDQLVHGDIGHFVV